MANHTDSGSDHLAAIMRAPCPCDSCPLTPRCGRELLCCTAFTLYARGVSVLRWQLAERVPSAERFSRLNPATDDKPPAARRPYRRKRLADSEAAQDWISPVQLERRLGICDKVRIAMERTGKLPPRDAQLGKRTGWKLSTITALSLARRRPRARAATVAAVRA
jgi:hypothetical protein